MHAVRTGGMRDGEESGMCDRAEHANTGRSAELLKSVETEAAQPPNAA